MVRISGVDLPGEKRIDVALTRLYGIGFSLARKILELVKIDGGKVIKDLKEEEVSRIQKIIDQSYKVEGDLHQEVSENIKRLQAIGSYRGLRHSKNLPVRGQRTRSNARTKRGKRVTIGALKKEVRARTEKTAVTKVGETKAKGSKEKKEK